MPYQPTIAKLESIHLPAVLTLVKELAEYENAELEVTTTLEDYLLLYDQGLYEGHVMLLDNEIVGMVIYYSIFSTWKGQFLYLEDFYIKSHLRNLGYGQLLFDRFLGIAKEKGCSGAKWQVLDWNTAAIKFYIRNHATIETQWHNGKIIF